MKKFKYRVEDLIRGVKEHPALWDKTSEVYKDRAERKQAWDEIFRCLEEDYDDMTREDKRIVSGLITGKWTNIRDTFLKSIRNRCTKIGTRKYHFHDEMSFLLKVMPPELASDYADVSDADADDSTTSSGRVKNLKKETSLASDEEAGTSFQWEDTETKRPKKFDRTSRNHSETPDRNHTRRKRSRLTETEHKPDEFPVDFLELNEVNDPRVMNEDEAFFASLLPTVVKYSEDERLEFRIEVLAVMKNINSKRRRVWNLENVE